MISSVHASHDRGGHDNDGRPRTILRREICRTCLRSCSPLERIDANSRRWHRRRRGSREDVVVDAAAVPFKLVNALARGDGWIASRARPRAARLERGRVEPVGETVRASPRGGELGPARPDSAVRGCGAKRDRPGGGQTAPRDGSAGGTAAGGSWSRRRTVAPGPLADGAPDYPRDREAVSTCSSGRSLSGSVRSSPCPRSCRPCRGSFADSLQEPPSAHDTCAVCKRSRTSRWEVPAVGVKGPPVSTPSRVAG